MPPLDDPVPLHETAKRFAEEYLIDFRVASASRRVGVTTQHGNDLLKDHRVQALIIEGKRRASDRVNISVDMILNQLAQIAMSSPMDYFKIEADAMGQSRPVLKLDELTDAQRDSLKSIKRTQFGYAVETHDKIGALDKLGKFLGMWTDKLELTGAGGKPLEMITSEMTLKQAAELYAASVK